MDELMKKLGENVRRFRLKRDMTQEELGEAAGIHYTFLGHIERGSKAPSLPTLARLAKALDLPMASLLKGFEQN